MLLRTRINLLVMFVFVLVCSGLLFASLEREYLINEQYSSTHINERVTFWEKLIEAQLLLMENVASEVLKDTPLIESLLINDPILILGHSQIVARHIITEKPELVDRFEVIYPDGSLAFSSISGVLQDSIISPEKARKNIAEGNWIRGIGNDEQRNIAVVLGIPLRISLGDDDKIVGMAVYAKNIADIISEMERMTRSDIFIVNQRGRFLSGSGSDLWSRIQDLVIIDEVNTLQTIKLAGRIYSVVVLPHEAGYGNLVGRLISIKDTTDSYQQQEQISQITIAVVIVFLALISIALGYYLSRLFLPLTEGVNVLNALSRGDLKFHMVKIESQDEVGRIASAVNIFRSNLIEFDRYRRSRHRQRQRQERFIRKEMTSLADTLDGDARNDVLSDLDQMSQETDGPSTKNKGGALTDSTSASGDDSSGLRLLASAFKKMSTRIQSQNQSLRESLETKTAFNALQGELGIAARVQLSFLPSPMPPTDSFDVAGTMKPAKEVGGDFYDFFRIDDYHIGVVVADVSGKGVPAALFMVMARTFLQSSAKHVHSPAKVLENLNVFLEHNNDEQLFITVFYGILDERNGRFTYANGGHNSPILSDSEDIRPLATTDGVLLGMFDDIEFDESYVDLEPGARLVLFTDGVTEAFDKHNEAFGDSRLLHEIHALPGQGSSSDNVTSIVHSVQAFTGEAPQFDDITCVVLRFKDYVEGASDEELFADQTTYDGYDDEYTDGEDAEAEYAENYDDGDEAQDEYADDDYAQEDEGQEGDAQEDYDDTDYKEDAYPDDYAKGSQYANDGYTSGYPDSYGNYDPTR